MDEYSVACVSCGRLVGHQAARGAADETPVLTMETRRRSDGVTCRQTKRPINDLHRAPVFWPATPRSRTWPHRTAPGSKYSCRHHRRTPPSMVTTYTIRRKSQGKSYARITYLM